MPFIPYNLAPFAVLLILAPLGVGVWVNGSWRHWLDAGVYGVMVCLFAVPPLTVRGAMSQPLATMEPEVVANWMAVAAGLMLLMLRTSSVVPRETATTRRWKTVGAWAVTFGCLGLAVGLRVILAELLLRPMERFGPIEWVLAPVAIAMLISGRLAISGAQSVRSGLSPLWISRRSWGRTRKLISFFVHGVFGLVYVFGALFAGGVNEDFPPGFTPTIYYVSFSMFFTACWCGFVALHELTEWPVAMRPRR